MKLSVFTLKGLAYEGDAISINAKTMSGEITVLDKHRPLVTILAKGDLKIVDKTGQPVLIPVSSGFLEVRSGNEASAILG